MKDRSEEEELRDGGEKRGRCGRRRGKRGRCGRRRGKRGRLVMEERIGDRGERSRRLENKERGRGNHR
jgi:hypothetical protein